MKINTATFVKSSSKNAELPPPTYPEYAFVGRSNVGKSSLINMLCERKKLAKTSSTPGKTQLINHFLINETWFLTDLPGYGYAKISKKMRSAFVPMIRNYLLKRENLMNVFMLVDSRHKPQSNDLEFMEFLGRSEVPFSIVFTKVDKLNNYQFEENILTYQKALASVWEEIPPSFFTSSINGKGRDDILDYIEKINQVFVKN